MNSIGHYIERELMVELIGTDKIDALSQIMAVIKTEKLLPDPDVFFKKILQREEECSTGIGLGVAIPHVRIESLPNIFIAVGRSSKGIDFATPDGTPVRLIFMIAISSNQAEYLKIISRISWLVRNEQFREQLFFSPSIGDLYQLLKDQG